MKQAILRVAAAGLMFMTATGVAVAAEKAATLAEVNKASGKKVVAGKKVRIETTKGVFEVTLFPKAAPKTVDNFVKLAKKGFYNGTTFHRVIPGFVAQGGDPLSKTLPAGHPRIGTGDPGYSIPDEHGNGLKHLTGSVAMAHSAEPNSAGSQFYICYQPISHLDGGYTIFGHVTKGMDVVNKLAPTERDGAATQGKPDKMLKVTVL